MLAGEGQGGCLCVNQGSLAGEGEEVARQNRSGAVDCGAALLYCLVRRRSTLLALCLQPHLHPPGVHQAARGPVPDCQPAVQRAQLPRLLQLLAVQRRAELLPYSLRPGSALKNVRTLDGNLPTPHTCRLCECVDPTYSPSRHLTALQQASHSKQVRAIAHNAGSILYMSQSSSINEEHIHTIWPHAPCTWNVSPQQCDVKPAGFGFPRLIE